MLGGHSGLTFPDLLPRGRDTGALSQFPRSIFFLRVSSPGAWAWERGGFKALSETGACSPPSLPAILMISDSLKAGNLTLIDYEFS